MPDDIDVGDVVRIRGVFRSSDATATDTTPTLTVKRPSGELDTPELDHTPDTGTYSADVEIDESGRWKYRWDATGTVVTAKERYFYVRRRSVG